MSSGDELIRRAREIHLRLMNPPNAVFDAGIDLKRHRIPYEPEVLLKNPETVFNDDGVYVGFEIPTITLKIKKPSAPVRDDMPMVATIIRVVCSVFEIRVSDLRGPARPKRLVEPRQFVSYLSKEYSGRSLPFIARLLNRDHTTILYSWRLIRKNLGTDPCLAQTVRMLEELILPSRYFSPYPYLPTICGNTVEEEFISRGVIELGETMQ